MGKLSLIKTTFLYTTDVKQMARDNCERLSRSHGYMKDFWGNFFIANNFYHLSDMVLYSDLLRLRMLLKISYKVIMTEKRSIVPEN